MHYFRRSCIYMYMYNTFLLYIVFLFVLFYSLSFSLSLCSFFTSPSLPTSLSRSITPPSLFHPKVTYSVDGFMEKNRDLLFKDLSQAMYACERPVLKSMFPEGNPSEANLKRPSTVGFKFKVHRYIRNFLENVCYVM